MRKYLKKDDVISSGLVTGHLERLPDGRILLDRSKLRSRLRNRYPSAELVVADGQTSSIRKKDKSDTTKTKETTDDAVIIIENETELHKEGRLRGPIKMDDRTDTKTDIKQNKTRKILKTPYKANKQINKSLDKPSTDKPSTDKPSTDKPSTDKPSINNEVIVIPTSDPNTHLLTDPIKSDWAKLPANVDLTHVIVTRFSYRFRESDKSTTIFAPARMKRRFQLLESFCFPSIISQTNPNFYWVLIIDKNSLPAVYLNKLYQLVAKFYESPAYKTTGPRQIILHKWEYNCTLSNIKWLTQTTIPLDRKYLVTTRFDDDDSLSKTFTKRIANEVKIHQPKGLHVVTFESGYYWYANHRLPYGVLKTVHRPLIAIGLTVIAYLEKFPMTVYFGNHTKLIRHIKDYENHRLLKKYTENYPEVPAQDQYSFSVVKRTEPMDT